jgi:oligopeptide/dipeptide ABC transporter ATP-binding protein
MTQQEVIEDVTAESPAPALAVNGLTLNVWRDGAPLELVQNVSFSVGRGEALGLVGESGSGKSLSLRGIAGLLPPGVEHAAGSTVLGADAHGKQGTDSRSARGRGLSMVFQEPMTALNPTMRVGDLITASPRIQHRWSRKRARAEAIRLLEEVGMPDPSRQARMWPHELSGGLRQRVMIAMALATDPRVLLCDEPTTALDVVVQEQILRLLRRIIRERDLAVIFVTHDLGVVRRLCDRVAVMYSGSVVEVGTADEMFHGPTHPYTTRLMQASPTIDVDRLQPLTAIPGRQPDPAQRGEGCAFAPRCNYAEERCSVEKPRLLPAGDHSSQSACLRRDEIVRSTRE